VKLLLTGQLPFIDRDARYRVNDFFCFDNAWRAVVSHLARGSDAVLVDLRGFGRQNSGVVFELTNAS
jgi:hypothetical protein